MMRSRLSAAVYLLLVFVSGTVVGGFAYRLYFNDAVRAAPRRPTPEEWRRRYIAEMRTNLKLTDDQVNKLTAVLDQTHHKMDDLHARFDPEMKRIQTDQRDEIRGFLTDSQKVTYDQMLAEREKRRRERELANKKGQS